MDTESFLLALYSRCEQSHGGLILTQDRSQFLAEFELGSATLFEDAATKVMGTNDCYFKVNPVDLSKLQQRRRHNGGCPIGRADEVKTIVAFVADVDADKPGYLDRPTTLSCIERMPLKPSLIVNSDGEMGGFHVYWILDEPYRVEDEKDRQKIASMSRRWQEELRRYLVQQGGKLDATANLDRLLRVCGNKRSNGNDVSCHCHDPNAKYSLDDLWLPRTELEIQNEAKRAAQNFAAKFNLGAGTDGEKPITDYVTTNGLTPQSLFEQEGWKQQNATDWTHPTSNNARSVRIADNGRGANFFSDCEGLFDPLIPGDCPNAGSPGRFYSTEAIFVNLHHGGDWKAAAGWCSRQFASSESEIDLSLLLRDETANTEELK